MFHSGSIIINVNLGNAHSEDQAAHRARRLGANDVLDEAHENAKNAYEQYRLGPQPCPPFVLMLRCTDGSKIEARATVGDRDYDNLRSAADARLDNASYSTGKAAGYQEAEIKYHGVLCVVAGNPNAGNPHDVQAKDDIACILVALASESARKSTK